MAKEGDFVKEDQEIVEFDSDKGSTTFRIPEGGKIIKFLVDIDGEYNVPCDFIEIDTDAKPEKSESKEEKKEPE